MRALFVWSASILRAMRIYPLLRPLLFALPTEHAHALALGALRRAHSARSAFARVLPIRATAVDAAWVCGFRIASGSLPASTRTVATSMRSARWDSVSSKWAP